MKKRLLRLFAPECHDQGKRQPTSRSAEGSNLPLSRKRKISGVLALGALVLSIGVGVSRRAGAQNGSSGSELPSWMGPVWHQALKSPILGQILAGQTPATIPQSFSTRDPHGTLTSYQPGGATATSTNGFFASLGSNGRTCFSCHQPQAGWAMNPTTAQAQFEATKGMDPLFAPVDGANCPDAGAAAKTLSDKEEAYSQLLEKANIRFFLPVPANAEYAVKVIRDPYGCETSTTYGLPTGIISMYRRVLNATNLSMNAQFNATFSGVVPQGAIMWDGREPSLQSQFVDATLGHAQATAIPGSGPIAQGVTFETSIFTAQSFDNNARSLTANGATGGPVALSTDPPFVPDFGSEGFTMYDGWGLRRIPPKSRLNVVRTSSTTGHSRLLALAASTMCWGAGRFRT